MSTVTLFPGMTCEIIHNTSGTLAVNTTHTHTHPQRPTVTSLLELQHKSSVFIRSVHIPEEEPTSLTATKDSSSESTTNSVNSYGPVGQVECSLENFKDLEKTSVLGMFREGEGEGDDIFWCDIHLCVVKMMCRGLFFGCLLKYGIYIK